MRQHLVESYIDQLLATFGSARFPVAEEDLQHSYDRRNYANMISHIKGHLNLNIGMRLGLVNSGGPNAPAWVQMPVYMPLYGTREFQSLTITVFLRKSFLQEGTFERVVCAIAHELCHVLLDGILHPLREKEEAVDLTAMLMGFRDFYVTGCNSVRDETSQEDLLAGYRVYGTRVLGYLTPEEVSHAATYMTYRRR
jgi:hypothetical protein